MSHLPLKLPAPTILAVAAAVTAALATALGVRFVDALLVSSSGIFAILCSLLAIGHLAHRPLSIASRAVWLLILVFSVAIAGTEFAEPWARSRGRGFALDDVADALLLATAPIGLWLSARVEPRAIAAQRLFIAGLAAQIGGWALHMLDGSAPEWAERYADLAQFLSLLSYLLAVWLLVSHRTLTGASQDAVEQLPANSKGVRGSLRDTLYPPPFLMGWGLPDPTTPAGRVHRLCNDALWPEGNVLLCARNLGTIALWPLIAAVRAVPHVRHYGDAVRRLTGKSKPRQFLEQVLIAVGYRISPLYYYVYELFRHGRWRGAPHYLMRYETKEIAFRLLYPPVSGRCTPTPLKDKVEFARHCRAHDIPHVPALMLFEDGKRVAGPDFVDRLPEGDVFVKRTNAKGGARSELWRYAGNGAYRDTRGRVMDGASLVARVAELSRGKPFFIQRAVRNHHDLLDLGAGALSTVRLLSCRNERGDFEVTNASFRMSVDPAAPVDNFHAGGIAAAVDLETGRLGAATDLGMGPEFHWYDRHPFTGAEVAGRRLPMWPEAVALAVRAHRVFHDHVLVGWDIAILDEGPCVIEGNRGPDMDLMQRPLGGPIGNGRFGELLAFNLEQRAKGG